LEAEGASKDRTHLRKRSLNIIRVFTSPKRLKPLHLRWALVRNLALRSLYFPLKVIIGIAGKKRRRTGTQKVTKQSLSNKISRHAKAPGDKDFLCLLQLTLSTFKQVLVVFSNEQYRFTTYTKHASVTKQF
jgi:hypothetical protein